jgi:hypothetical protein
MGEVTGLKHARPRRRREGGNLRNRKAVEYFSKLVGMCKKRNAAPYKCFVHGEWGWGTMSKFSLLSCRFFMTWILSL